MLPQLTVNRLHSRWQTFLVALIVLQSIAFQSIGQSSWPKEITTAKKEKIVIYQPQSESLTGNLLKARAAIAVYRSANAEPIFGVVWVDAILQTDRDSRMASLESTKITNIKFPDEMQEQQLSNLKYLVEQEIPKWNIRISIDDITTSLENDSKAARDNFDNTPPKIIYKTETSTLILIDGDAKWETDKDIGLEKVINSPYLIVKNDDKKLYLFDGDFWYTSGKLETGWVNTTLLKGKVKDLDKNIKEQQKKDSSYVSATEQGRKPTAIIISTVPAELIQSDGKADFATIAGTGLLYMSNSSNNIFMDVSSQDYFVLLSGRWYKSKALVSGWEYVAADKLPADFAKIPEGSEKDEVLISVAGTDASKEAVMDAQIPQTAKVDRQTATCTVKYDGTPKFDPIDGTSMSVAMNTSSTVLQSGSKYFCVENGVWFESQAATGPWQVATERPSEVEKIPANNKAYNTKYVYVYSSTPQYVYMGYTPGYMGSYIYGPTIVYGTGFYYNPWYGPYYYPRPVTWGFRMSYNPWTGWNVGFGVSVGWFGMGVHFGGYGGWFGPPMYRPPYRPYPRGPIYGPRRPGGGYYNRPGYQPNNNIYNNRGGIASRDRVANDGRFNNNNSRNPGSRPTAGTARTRQNNVYSDRNGDVYRRGNDGQFNKRENKSWQRTDNQRNQQLQRESFNRNRSQDRFNSNPGLNRSRQMPAGGGGFGGSRGGGGGRRR